MEEKEIIQTKTLEKFYNKLHRYRKRLVIEGIKVIKNEGLELRVREDRGIRLVNGSPTVWVGKKETDMKDLIKLSKKRVPSLYRRYYEGLEKMRNILNYK